MQWCAWSSYQHNIRAIGSNSQLNYQTKHYNIIMNNIMPQSPEVYRPFIFSPICLVMYIETYWDRVGRTLSAAPPPPPNTALLCGVSNRHLCMLLTWGLYCIKGTSIIGGIVTAVPHTPNALIQSSAVIITALLSSEIRLSSYSTASYLTTLGWGCFPLGNQGELGRRQSWTGGDSCSLHCIRPTQVSVSRAPRMCPHQTCTAIILRGASPGLVTVCHKDNPVVLGLIIYIRRTPNRRLV